LLNVDGVLPSIVAHIIGKAAFLLPETRTNPFNRLFPCTNNDAMVSLS